MNRFMLSAHSSSERGCSDTEQQMDPAAMQEMMARVWKLEAEMKASGALVLSGRLHDAADATVVRAYNGAVETLDGPFAETKEQLGGFYILDAEDREAALAWASKVSECVGIPIEVRAFAAVPEPQEQGG